MTNAFTPRYSCSVEREDLPHSAPCSWLVEYRHDLGEEYETRTRECGLPAVTLPCGGYLCAAGHEHHVYGLCEGALEDLSDYEAEVRYEETGVAYA